VEQVHHHQVTRPEPVAQQSSAAAEERDRRAEPPRERAVVSRLSRSPMRPAGSKLDFSRVAAGIKVSIPLRGTRREKELRETRFVQSEWTVAPRCVAKIEWCEPRVSRRADLNNCGAYSAVMRRTRTRIRPGADHDAACFNT